MSRILSNVATICARLRRRPISRRGSATVRVANIGGVGSHPDQAAEEKRGTGASIKGRNGGVRLGRSPDQITLGEIYRSSIGDKPLWAPRQEGPRECLVTNHCAEYFAKLTDETEAAVLGALAGRTLADSLDELRVIDRASDTPTSEPALARSAPHTGRSFRA